MIFVLFSTNQVAIRVNDTFPDPFIFNYLGSLCLLFPLVCQVIVRDIVSKAVIAQFRAHKSPISALCFDPSGTLLVSASVLGHNINVFKIMPGPPGVPSSTDADAPYVHLYRLQRGITNAVRTCSCLVTCRIWCLSQESLV